MHPIGAQLESSLDLRGWQLSPWAVASCFKDSVHPSCRRRSFQYMQHNTLQTRQARVLSTIVGLVQLSCRNISEHAECNSGYASLPRSTSTARQECRWSLPDYHFEDCESIGRRAVHGQTHCVNKRCKRGANTVRDTFQLVSTGPPGPSFYPHQRHRNVV